VIGNLILVIILITIKLSVLNFKQINIYLFICSKNFDWTFFKISSEMKHAVECLLCMKNLVVPDDLEFLLFNYLKKLLYEVTA
jgi:hypothetical protein